MLVLGAFCASAQPLAFPGAEGFGRFATGGRGGDVVYVTNLNDSGPGSFREAVSRPRRTVVFGVGGVIQITNRIVVSPHVTIAGQTAPGDGVTIYGNGVSFSGADNNITRHLRFRMGVRGDRGKDAVAIAHGHTMVFDHLSVSWGRDENFSISGPVTNITIQNSIIAQGLQTHSCGGLMQTDGGVSLLRNLYINNHTRNPKVKGVNQFVNNIVYNWGVGAYILGDSAGKSYANVIGNYFINGPGTRAAAFTRGNLNFHLYAANNWQDDNRNSQLDGKELSRAEYDTVAWLAEPFDYPSITTVTPLEAWKIVATRAGAFPRDGVDNLLIGELESHGQRGSIIAKETDEPMSGPGLSSSGKPLTDTDRDGLPDAWELATGSNPKLANHNDPAPTNGYLPSHAAGYTRIEEYLHFRAMSHGYVAPATANLTTAMEVDLQRYTRGFGNKAQLEVSAVAGGKVKLTSQQRARFEPTPGFTGRAKFNFTVRDAMGSAWTREFLVLVAELQN
jgi:pectate lyase